MFCIPMDAAGPSSKAPEAANAVSIADHEMTAAIEVLEKLGRDHTLELLQLLKAGTGKRGVQVLADALGLSQANLSKLIQLLSLVGYLECDRNGKHRIYRISQKLREDVQALCCVLSNLVLENNDPLISHSSPPTPPDRARSH